MKKKIYSLNTAKVLKETIKTWMNVEYYYQLRISIC